jgi:hypothetical protein
VFIEAGIIKPPAEGGTDEFEWDDVDVSGSAARSEPQAAAKVADCVVSLGSVSVGEEGPRVRNRQQPVEAAREQDKAREPHVMSEVASSQAAAMKLRGRRRKRQVLNDDSGDETGGDFGAAVPAVASVALAATSAAVAATGGERAQRVERPSLAVQGFNAQALARARRPAGVCEFWMTIADVAFCVCADCRGHWQTDIATVVNR